jgi:hypothetical protein
MTNAVITEQAQVIAGDIRASESLSLCIGAGSAAAAGLPSLQELLKQLLAEVGQSSAHRSDWEEFVRHTDAREVLSLISSDIGKERVAQFILKKVASLGVPPSDLHRAIASIPAENVLTTNFDSLLEQSIVSSGKSVTVVASDEDLSLMRQGTVSVVKLYGSADRPPTLRFSLRDEEPGAPRSIDSYVRTLFTATRVLFIGFSPESKDLEEVYERFATGSSRADWVAVVPSANSLVTRLWSNRGVRIEQCDVSNMPALLREVGRLLLERVRPVPQVTRQWRVFVGSSAEALPVARQVQSALTHLGHDTLLWTDTFSGGASRLDLIDQAVHSADAAVLVFTPDDSLRGREGRRQLGQSLAFELGLLVGRLGRERVLVVASQGSELQLPGDLLGIRFVVVDPNRPEVVMHFVGRWLSMLGVAS